MPQSTKQIVSDGKGNHSRLAVPISVQKFRQLSELCDYSPEIVVGVVVSKSSREEANSMVLTDYDVAVLETLKGDRHKGRTLTLQVPGGSATSSDGTVNELRMPDFWANPELGQAYVFFLKKKNSFPSQLVGGPQGLFRISPWPEAFSLTSPPDVSAGRVIIPEALESNDSLQRLNRMPVAAFLAEIKKVPSVVAAMPRRMQLRKQK